MLIKSSKCVKGGEGESLLGEKDLTEYASITESVESEVSYAKKRTLAGCSKAENVQRAAVWKRDSVFFLIQEYKHCKRVFCGLEMRKKTALMR